jgi:3-methyladenine DNA glycosylase Mpg
MSAYAPLPKMLTDAQREAVKAAIDSAAQRYGYRTTRSAAMVSYSGRSLVSLNVVPMDLVTVDGVTGELDRAIALLQAARAVLP